MRNQSKMAAQFRTNTGKARTALTGFAFVNCCAALSAGNGPRATEVAQTARLTAPVVAQHLGIAQVVASAPQTRQPAAPSIAV